MKSSESRVHRPLQAPRSNGMLNNLSIAVEPSSPLLPLLTMATIRPGMRHCLPAPASPEEACPVSQISAPPWLSRRLLSCTFWSRCHKPDSAVPPLLLLVHPPSARYLRFCMCSFRTLAAGLYRKQGHVLAQFLKCQIFKCFIALVRGFLVHNLLLRPVAITSNIGCSREAIGVACGYSARGETDWLLHGICSIGTQLSAGRLQTDVAVRCHLQLPC